MGLGNIGMLYDFKNKNKNYYFTHSKSIKFSRNYDLKAGVEISNQKRNLFKKKFKLPVFKDLNTALNKMDVNLLVIATEENNHLKLLKNIKNFKKIKYIILEKPGGKNYKELNSIYEICEKNNIKLFLNYFRMYDDYYSKKIKDIFFKKSIEVIANYKRGIRNNCSHIINLLLMFNTPKSLKDIKIATFIKHFNNKNKIINVCWNNTKVIFIDPDIKKLSLVKIQVFSDKKYISSNNDLSEFDLYEKNKSKLIINNSEFNFYRTIKNINKEKYQKLFYDNFEKKIKYYKYYKKISLLTSYIIDKMLINN